MDTGFSRLFQKRSDRQSLGTRTIGTKVFVYDLVTSTNDLAHFLAKSGEPDGTVIFAHGQSQGRGRMGNFWISPYGKGIYSSIILRPKIDVDQMPLVTLTMALAVVSAFEEIHLDGALIKWPNDILCADQKIAGILTEMHLDADMPGYCVVGLGLNVNARSDELPESATSVFLQIKREFDIADLAHIIMKYLDRYYADVLLGRHTSLLAKIKEHSGLVLGERVRVISGSRVIEGYAVDFDDKGGLVVRLDNGFCQPVYAGHLIRLGSS